MTMALTFRQKAGGNPQNVAHLRVAQPESHVAVTVASCPTQQLTAPNPTSNLHGPLALFALEEAIHRLQDALLPLQRLRTRLLPPNSFNEGLARGDRKGD